MVAPHVNRSPGRGEQVVAGHGDDGTPVDGDPRLEHSVAGHHPAADELEVDLPCRHGLPLPGLSLVSDSG